MGCEQSLRNMCGSHGNANKITPGDDFEFDHNNGDSTKREKEMNTNRSDLSEGLFINTNLNFTGEENKNKNGIHVKNNHKFFLNMEKIKSLNNNHANVKGSDNNFESDRSNNSVNLQVNLSEIKDNIDTQRRQGKAFILLIKEFNFIHKLYRKCQMKASDSSNKENEQFNSPKNDISFTSNNSLQLSLQSNYTVNSIMTDNSKFQIKSTILKETKMKTKSKEFFSKVKNLIYIPVISLTGEVFNSFILMKDASSKKLTLMNYVISIPLFDSISTYLFNFLQNFHTNLNNCKLSSVPNNDENCESENFDFNSNANNVSQLVSLLSVIKMMQFKKIKFCFDLSESAGLKEGDEMLKFGIGVNVLTLKSNILSSSISKIGTGISKLLNQILTSVTIGNIPNNNSLAVEEIFCQFSYNNMIIENTGYQIVFSFNTLSSINIRNYIYKILLTSEDEDKDKANNTMKVIEEIITNFSGVKRIILDTILSQDSLVKVQSISLKREVKSTNSNFDKFTFSNNKNYSNEFVKTKFEIISFNIDNNVLPIVNYEYQL